MSLGWMVYKQMSCSRSHWSLQHFFLPNPNTRISTVFSVSVIRYEDKQNHKIWRYLQLTDTNLSKWNEIYTWSIKILIDPSIEMQNWICQNYISPYKNATSRNIISLSYIMWFLNSDLNLHFINFSEFVPF